MKKKTKKSTVSVPETLASNWSENIPDGTETKAFDVDLHYDDRGGSYYRRDDRGNYIKAKDGDARRYLRTLGFSRKSAEGDPSEMDHVLEFVQRCQNCDYASALAGHKAGLQMIEGRRILVTVGPRLVDPAPGEWNTVRAVIEGLLGDEQAKWFYAWLKIAIHAVRNSRHRKGQALIVAGPANCGKSLCQAIITALLGGRIAKPFPYLCGRTEFNSEMFGAEHLMIEDEPASSDPRVRKKFGAEIKGLVANTEQRCHAKNREGLTLRPIWRLSITLNDDPASLLVLPQWEEGLKDKLMLFHARSFQMPVDTLADGGQDKLWKSITDELPAFVHFLESFVIREEMRDSRFGVKAFHNSELLELMDAMTDEMKLLEMVDSTHFNAPQAAPWEGRANELEELLRDATGFRQLITSANTCGSLLGALAKRKERVEKLPKRQGAQRWRILPPSED